MVGRLWDFFTGVLKQQGQRENLKVREEAKAVAGRSGQNLADLKAGYAVGDRACWDEQSGTQNSKEEEVVLEASFHALWTGVWVGRNG